MHQLTHDAVLENLKKWLVVGWCNKNLSGILDIPLSCLLSLISCIPSPVSRLPSPISRLSSTLSRLLSSSPPSLRYPSTLLTQIAGWGRGEVDRDGKRMARDAKCQWGRENFWKHIVITRDMSIKKWRSDVWHVDTNMTCAQLCPLIFFWLTNEYPFKSYHGIWFRFRGGIRIESLILTTRCDWYRGVKKLGSVNKLFKTLFL